jgi:hypothetical protein
VILESFSNAPLEKGGDSMSGIFVSYRREDTADTVGRLYGDLIAAFGQERIFKDTSSMITGRDFVDQIHRAIAQCNVMLVLIGPRWLQAASPSGVRRIDEPNDFVRQEIELARQSGVDVIPVLAQGARMPAESELPSSIQFLHRLDAAPVRPDPDYLRDTQRLIQKILTLAPQLTPRFNPEAALARAGQKSVPADWTVWRPSAGSSATRGFAWFFVAVRVTASIGFLILIVSLFGHGTSASDQAFTSFVAVLGATFVIAVIAGFAGLMTGAAERGHALLVLTSDGVAQQIGGATHWIDFAMTESISLQTTRRQRVPFVTSALGDRIDSLMILGRDGKMASWALDFRFGSAQVISQAIIAAHERYRQSHRALGVPQLPSYLGDSPAGGGRAVSAAPVLPGATIASADAVAQAPMYGSPLGAPFSSGSGGLALQSAGAQQQLPSPLGAGIRVALIIMAALIGLTLPELILHSAEYSQAVILAQWVAPAVAGFMTVRRTRLVWAGAFGGLTLGILYLVVYYALFLLRIAPHFEVIFNGGPFYTYMPTLVPYIPNDVLLSVPIAFIGGLVGRITVRR